MTASEWYKDAIIYELRARSYQDSDGDGIGDLRGLTARLDYLADLGITAIWLLPHYPSPGRDDGYDIADYTSVHPEAGTLGDFDDLVAEAHRRGIRIITELVINHTSDQHPWFQRARRAPRGSTERDFYVWSDTATRYEQARIIFSDAEPSNWTWDPAANAYYFHRFFAHQPDLNFDNPAVADAVLSAVDFWLERGVDGLRLDAIPYLFKREGTACENLPETHAFIRRLRAHIDGRFEDRLLLAEANQWPDDAARYFGAGDECHMAFHFPMMPRLFMAMHMEDRFPIVDILRQTPELPRGCQWAMFLRNHDELTLETVTDEERDYMYRAYAHEPQMRLNLGIRRRLAPLCGNDRRKIELLNALLFSMPGTPVMYYGDEIGMGDNLYLGDRNGVRTPMQWSPDRNAGFSRGNAQRLDLPVVIDPEYHYEAVNVEAQQANPSSLLWWTKRLVALRKRHRAFGRGTVELLASSNPAVLAFLRRYEAEVLLVVTNLSRRVQYVELGLAALKGMTPVEMMGGKRFPAIGDAPYTLSLGGYDYYWFSLEPPLGPTENAERLGRFVVPTLTVTSPRELLAGSERAMLESVLLAFFDAQGWLERPTLGAHIVETVKIADAPAAFLVFVRVDLVEGEALTFALPLVVLAFDAEVARFVGESAPKSPGALVANLRRTGETADVTNLLLVFAGSEGVGRIMFDAVVRGASIQTVSGQLVARAADGVTLEADLGRDARLLSSDPSGAVVAYGTSQVFRHYCRIEELASAELDAARLLSERGVACAPRVLGWVEYRAHRKAPVTLAVLEEQIANEGTAWSHARAELNRAYEHVLARPADATRPVVPEGALMLLARTPVPPADRELVGTYRERATRLGARVAELHLALASSRERAFEPVAYTVADRRSKYQNLRNRVGRVFDVLRRLLADLPTETRTLAEQVLAAEAELVACFEPLRTTEIDAKRIRIHGDLHLGRVLFTGRDFVVLISGGHRRDVDLRQRARKASALRDVASLIRSFHDVAADALGALRPEDQARAKPWSPSWARWTSASFLRGYLDAAGDAPFLSRDPAVTTLLLESALIERVLQDAWLALRSDGPTISVALHGILDVLGGGTAAGSP